MKDSLPYNVMRYSSWDFAPRDPATVGGLIMKAIGMGAAASAPALLGMTTVGAVVGYVATTALTSWALAALAPDIDSSGLRGRLVNSRAAVSDQQYVYGQVRKGGTITYMESTGAENKYLHSVIALAGHECEEIGDIYLNDEIVTVNGSGYVTSAPWNSKIRILKHDGSQTVADSTLVAETSVDSTFVGNGIAYLYVRMENDQDAFAGGIPKITTVVKGRKVYDPRTGLTEYSNNAALCVRDYVVGTYGWNDSVVDDTYFSVAANDCDDAIPLSGGGTQARYTIDGVIKSGSSMGQIAADLMTSCNGVLYKSGGYWKLKVGVYTPSVRSFTLADVYSGISISTKAGLANGFNTVRGKFIHADEDWIESEYPPVESAVFLAEDAGIENELDLELPFTTNAARAQRVAKQILFRAREQMTLTAEFSLAAMDVEVGDIVDFTADRYGWANKLFQVETWKLLIEPEKGIRVAMTLRETSSEAFDWAAEETALAANDTNLPSFSDAQTVSLDAAVASTDVNNDGSTVPSISFTWSVPDETFVKHYEFEWKLSTDSNWNALILHEPRFQLSPAISGAAYDYRVRSVNHLGFRSGYASSATPVSTGDDGTTPNAPTSVTAVGGYGSMLVTWVAPTQNTDASDLKDLFQYRVYRGTTTNPTTLVGRVSGEIFTDNGLDDAQTYYYRIKAVDFTGNESAYSANASSTTNAALSDGERGAGRWHVGVTTLPTTSSGADTDFTAAIGNPVDYDQAWFYTGTLSNPTAQSVWIYDLGTDTWTEQTEVIDGSLLVTGSVTAAAIAISDETASSRVEIADNKILIYDSGVLRVKIGDLA